MSGGGDRPDVAALAAWAEGACDLGDHMAVLLRMLGAARRTRLAPPVTGALSAAAAALGARPAALYLAGRGSGTRYATDAALRGDAAEVSAALTDAATEAARLAAAALTGGQHAADEETAAEVAIAAIRELPPALCGGALAAAQAARWDAAWRAGEAARIAAEVGQARAALEFAAARLDLIPTLLAEAYEPLYEITERPGGRLPADPDFITGDGLEVPGRKIGPTEGGIRERSTA